MSINKFILNGKALTGKELQTLTSRISLDKKRFYVDDVVEFCRNRTTDLVLGICGIRRTGKTYSILQTIKELAKEISYNKILYYSCKESTTMKMLELEIKNWIEQGIEYLFIDEITRIEMFPDSCAYLYDIYAKMGIKLVITGTDSYSLNLAILDQLYDRCILIHTTKISYQECCSITGISSLEEYVKTGGLLLSGDISSLAKDHSTPGFTLDTSGLRQYIDTALVDNIIHSLKGYQNGKMLNNLEAQGLNAEHSLKYALLKIVFDDSHKLLTNTFRSMLTPKTLQLPDISAGVALQKNSSISEYDIATYNIIASQKVKDDIFTQFCTAMGLSVTNLTNTNKIRECVSFEAIEDITNILHTMDILRPTREVILNTLTNDICYNDDANVLYPPCIRYGVAKLQVNLVRNYVSRVLKRKIPDLNKILENAEGRLIEDIIYSETLYSQRVSGDSQLLKIQFNQAKITVGEIDMAIDDGCNNIVLYKIKRSKDAVDGQAKHLVDERFTQSINQLWDIKKRCILYNGPTLTKYINGVEVSWINIYEYLMSLEDLTNSAEREICGIPSLLDVINAVSQRYINDDTVSKDPYIQGYEVLPNGKIKVYSSHVIHKRVGDSNSNELDRVGASKYSTEMDNPDNDTAEKTYYFS